MSDPNRLWRSRVHSVWGQFQAQLAANHQEVLDSGGLPEKHAHSALMSLCQRSSRSGINTCVRPHFLEQLHPEHPVRLGTEADTRKPPVQPDAEELLTARSHAHSLTTTAPQALSTHCPAGEPALYWGEARGGPWPRKPPAGRAHFLLRPINFSVTQRPLRLKSSEPPVLKPTVFVSKYSFTTKKAPKASCINNKLCTMRTAPTDS